MEVGNSKTTNDDDIQASEAPISLRPNQPAETKVKVALRVRPFIHKEIMDNEQKCTQCYLQTGQVLIGKDKTFSFDYVFDAESRQEEIYESCAKDLVSSCLAGYNTTILAYGQTGSGKTFTMGSNTTYETDPKDTGIIPRVMKELFAEIEKRKTKSEFILRVSFLEIYNEEIQDLLDTTTARFRFNPAYINKNPIAIREEKDGSISVYGAKEEKVTSFEEMSAYLEKGSLKRSTASTLMNETSSRSHGIFTISIEQHQIDDLYLKKTAKPKAGADTSFTIAKFHFVDLAGSERLKKTGASGAILREGININRGLLALGNVISALTDLSGKISHVPYRESKLTRILQDSLGGNSRTVMIACISPAESNFDESLNTLKYASRARNIKNKPIVNTDPQSTVISQLKQQVFELQRQLLSYKKIISTDLKDNYQGDPKVLASLLSGTTSFAAIGGQDEYEVLKEEVKNLKIKLVQHEKELTIINNELHQTKNELNQSEISNFSVQKERDLLKLLSEKYKKILEENNLYTPPAEEDSELVDLEKETLVEEYSKTIEKLKHDLKDKEQLSHEMNKEYESLLQSSARDQELLLEKTKTIQALKAQLRKQENANKFQGANPNTADDDSTGKGASQNELRNAEDFEENEDDKMEQEFDMNSQRHRKEMLLVDGNINEKEELLKSMTQNQILLEKSLMDDMKNQYYKKVMLMEQEVKTLEKQRDEALSKMSNVMADNDKGKVVTTYKQKISELETKMKDFRKKEREQQSLMKLVDSQRNKIQHLDDEIKKIKTQKMQLHKKVREESEKFEKWKTSRQKELLEAKKNNVEKDLMISKLRTENKKKDMIYKKKADEMLAKYMSKELLLQIQTDTAKTPMASTPSAKKKKTISLSGDESGFFGVDDSQIATATEEDAKQLIEYCTDRLLENLRVSHRVEKEEESLRKTEEELDQERNRYAELMLKRDRIEIERRGSTSDLDFEQALESKLQEFDLEMNEVYTHIETLEAKLDFQLAKINEFTDDLSRRPKVSPEQLLLHNDKIIKNPSNLKIVLRCLFGKHISSNLEIVKLQEKNSQQIMDMIEMRKRIEESEQKARFNELQYEISLTKLTKEYEKSQQFLLVKEQAFDEDMEDNKDLLDAMGPGQGDPASFNFSSSQNLENIDTTGVSNLDATIANNLTPSEKTVESPTKKSLSTSASSNVILTKGKLPGESLADQNKRLEKMVTELTRKQTSNEKIIGDLKKRCEVLQMKYDQLKRPGMKERTPNLKANAEERLQINTANDRSQYSTNASMMNSSLNMSAMNTGRKLEEGESTTRAKEAKKGLSNLASLREKRKEEKFKQNITTPSNKTAPEESKMDRQRTLSNLDIKSQNLPDIRTRKHTATMFKGKTVSEGIGSTDLNLKKKPSHSESMETGDSGVEDIIEESTNWK